MRCVLVLVPSSAPSRLFSANMRLKSSIEISNCTRSYSSRNFAYRRKRKKFLFYNKLKIYIKKHFYIDRLLNSPKHFQRVANRLCPFRQRKQRSELVGLGEQFVDCVAGEISLPKCFPSCTNCLQELWHHLFYLRRIFFLESPNEIIPKALKAMECCQ